MSVKEILHFRLPQFVQTHIKGHFQANKKPRLLLLNESYMPKRHNKTDLERLFLRTPFSTQVDVFNELVDVFNISNWREDVANSITSPLNYYGNIKRQNFNVNGDVKFVSELSRMEFLPYLAFKAVSEVSVQEAYLKQIEQIVTNWNVQNPYLKSIHWTSGIEVGIRSVNLIYTHSILKQFNRLTPQLDFEINTQISNNYSYLKNHLSLFSSANNHLMAELMGLNVIASYFQVTSNEAKKWQQMFFNQIKAQVNLDGVHMELCTRYHAEVTDQIVIGLTFLKQTGTVIPDGISNRLKGLFSFTEHTEYQGEETIFGDNDEGFVINPYFDKSFSLYQSQLKTANYLFNTDYKSDGVEDFRNYLIFGNQFSCESKSKLELDTMFKDSGYCFMYDHETKTKLSFDCGAIGDNISAAHGHSDVFHFNLSVQGFPFIVDSGTYQYHTKDTFWRNYFRSIQAHNTVSVNGKNHAVNNNRMSWINCPEVKIEEFSLTKELSSCKGTTNAFIKENVVHSREIDFNKETSTIVINDVFNGLGNEMKEIKLFLHFHPSVNVKLDNDVLRLKQNHTNVNITNQKFVNSRLIIGDEKSPLGWFSNSFNKKQASTTLVLKTEFRNELKLKTIINYDN